MNDNNTPKKYTWYKFGNLFATVADTLEAVFVAVVVAIIFLTLVFRLGYVEGRSMLPTMEPGEQYLLSDLLYTPKQGDIVVFAPDSTVRTEEPLWVKRVIATEGQEVYINPDDNCVYVDGMKLDEYYLDDDEVTLARSTPNPITVPQGCVYLMGDNRTESRDGRDIGCVDVRRIIGRVIYRLPN